MLGLLALLVELCVCAALLMTVYWKLCLSLGLFQESDEPCLEVRKALNDDKYEGHVWLPSRYKGNERKIVKITHKGKSAYCEASVIDGDFLKKYCLPKNERLCGTDCPIIVMPMHYRITLGINEEKVKGRCKVSKFPCSCKEIVERQAVTITFAQKRNWVASYLACTNHPMVAVRLSARLGVLSLILGVLSLWIALLPTASWSEARDSVICLLVAIGFG